MSVRNKAAMAAASTTSVLVLLVPLLTGSIRAQAAENVPSFAPTEATPPRLQKRRCSWKVPCRRYRLR